MVGERLYLKSGVFLLRAREGGERLYLKGVSFS